MEGIGEIVDEGLITRQPSKKGDVKIGRCRRWDRINQKWDILWKDDQIRRKSDICAAFRKVDGTGLCCT